MIERKGRNDRVYDDLQRTFLSRVTKHERKHFYVFLILDDASSSGPFSRAVISDVIDDALLLDLIVPDFCMLRCLFLPNGRKLDGKITVTVYVTRNVLQC